MSAGRSKAQQGWAGSRAPALCLLQERHGQERHPGRPGYAGRRAPPAEHGRPRPSPVRTAGFVPSGWKRQVKARDGGVDSLGYRLCLLGFDHINMLSRYAFILPDGIARGELRPLRDPTADSHDEG